MLERMRIQNFKRFEDIEVEMGATVLFIGPNNAGKTTALQALALWQLGVQRWHEKRGSGTSAQKRPGVSINRRDLFSTPVPDCKQLWRELHVRRVDRSQGKQKTQNIRIYITVEGIDREKCWSCDLEFDFANPESFYCRPADNKTIPPEALKIKIAFLPPMSGLASNEVRLDHGAIQVRLGEGRTAEVLRNLCYMLHQQESSGKWDTLHGQIDRLFGVRLNPPEYLIERGEITMNFREPSGVELDLAASGRGLQQTLLLLAYVYANPGSVILLDEPDAHLEILRQRQVYEIINQTARENDCQIIAASHSEVLLNEAADRDVVIAFVGAPHRIDGRGSQVMKALRSIGFEQYYQAEQKGWVLYLEGSTDLAILRTFARTLQHPVQAYLECPFVYYIGNQLSRAQEHFHGLREAKPDLVGVAILDRQDTLPPSQDSLLQVAMWQRREIENYLCMPEVLETYVRQETEENSLGPLFAASAANKRLETMRECVRDQIPPAAYRDRNSDWWANVKASDEFLDRVFADYFARLELPNLLRKTDYHVIAGLVPSEDIDPDVTGKLDFILEVACRASPRDAQFSQ